MLFSTFVVIAMAWSPVVILSDSMHPVIRPGDVVFIDWNVDHGNIRVGEDGDIVVIDGPSIFIENGVPGYLYAHLKNTTPIVHRAIEKRCIDGRWYFVTKGDNNVHPDGCIRYKSHLNDTYALIEYNYSNPVLVPEDNVIGVVILVVPCMGFLKIHAPSILACCLCLIAGILVARMQGRWRSVEPRETCDVPLSS